MEKCSNEYVSIRISFQFYPEKEEENRIRYFQFSQFVTRYNDVGRWKIFVSKRFFSHLSVQRKWKTSINFHHSRIRIVSNGDFWEFDHNAQVFHSFLDGNAFWRLIFSVENFSLQIRSISVSFVVGLCGGDHSLQRLVSSRVASKLSIDTIYDSSARKYFEYIIKAVRFPSIKKTLFPMSFVVISVISIGNGRKNSFINHSRTIKFSRSWIFRNLFVIVVRKCVES